MFALAPGWLAGCRLRDGWFEPTFHKHAGKLCNGVQIHVDDDHYQHGDFSSLVVSPVTRLEEL